MSILLLREDCTPIFEEYGLSKLHINVINKQLVIVGECGQSLCPINGVVLSSNTRISVSERNIIKKYLRSFLDKNKAIINEYIAKRIEQKSIAEAETPPNFTGTGTSSSYINGTYVPSVHSINFKKELPSGHVVLYYSVDPKVLGSVTLSVSLSDMADFSLVPTFIEESVNNAIIYNNELTKVNKINEEIKAIRAKLNSCKF